MSLYQSKTGIIDSCETLICMDGIAAIANNDGIDGLYLFRDALTAVGATAKLAVIEEAVALYESIHGRMPSQDEAEEIGDESSSEFAGLDEKFFGCKEDLDALCVVYTRGHPEEIPSLRKIKNPRNQPRKSWPQSTAKNALHHICGWQPLRTFQTR